MPVATTLVPVLSPDKNSQYQTPAVTVVQNLIKFLEEENCKPHPKIWTDEIVNTVFFPTTAANTFQEFDQKIRKKIADLKGSDASAEVECVTEIFLRYISLRTAHFNVSCKVLRHCDSFLTLLYQVFKDAKIDLRQRGMFFLKNVSESKQKVAKIGQTFVCDGTVSITSVAASCSLLHLIVADNSGALFFAGRSLHSD